MLRSTKHLCLLVGAQFVFLVAGLGCEISESQQGPLTKLDDANFLLMVGHALLLVALAWCLVRAQRRDARYAAALNRQLSEALRRAEDLTECSSDMVWETNMSGVITFISDHNGVMTKDWNLRPGMLMTELLNLDTITPREAWVHQFESRAQGEPFRNFHYSLRRPNGAIAHFCSNGIPIRLETGELVGFRGTTRDRTTECEALQTLSHQALHDALTGLPNRRYLLDHLDAAAQSPETALAVLLLDLDGFKTINDLHGHAVGDQLLRAVAERLREIIRPVDFVCRLGGDEFAIVISGIGTNNATLVAQRVIDALTTIFLVDTKSLRIGVSVGIALAPDHGPVSSLLLRFADQALYEVKRVGGSGVRLYQAFAEEPVEAIPKISTLDSVVQELRNLASMPSALEGALARDEFSLAFQPIRCCENGSVAAVEALLRWNNPTLGPVPPDVFIPIAEESGLIVPIGAWVLRQACQRAVEAGGSWRIAVNLSPAQFQQPDLALAIGCILHDTGLQPERLILELTEQILVSQFPTASATFRKLRAMGVALALDDFGAGFSNVAYLRDFRFDLLKIDRSILSIAETQREQALQGLLTIARAFGMVVVVEGVERPEDWDMLQRLGSNYAQGFLLGRPQPDIATSLAEVPDEDRLCLVNALQ